MPENGTLAEKADKRRHWLVKNSNLLVAKMSTTVLNGGEVLTHGSYGLLSNVDKVINGSMGTMAALEAGTKSVIGLAGMGVVAATAAAMAQMDYRHEIDNLVNTYRDELAAKLGKPGHAITEKDLNVLAKGDAARGIEANGVVRQELRKKRAERNLGVLLSAGASLATLAAVSAILAPLAGVATAVGLPLLLVEGLSGVAIYNVVKHPLKAIGHKLFGLDHQTTHDRIEGLKRDHEDGKTITRAQMLSVFASANPKLDSYIEGRYGAHFDKLGAADQQRAVQDPQVAEALARVTEAVNRNWLRIGELAFTVVGQESGFDPALQPSAHRQSRLGEMMVTVCKTIGLGSLVAQHPQSEAPPEYDNPAPAVSFVDQYHARAGRPRDEVPVINR